MTMSITSSYSINIGVTAYQVVIGRQAEQDQYKGYNYGSTHTHVHHPCTIGFQPSKTQTEINKLPNKTRE